MRHTTGLALATALLVAGCSDSTSPDAMAGTYVLSTVFSSSSPPFTIWTSNTRTTVIEREEGYADTLELRGDGTWIERSTFRSTTNETTNPVVSFATGTSQGSYSHADGKLVFRFDSTGVPNQGLLHSLDVKSGATVAISGDTLLVENVTLFSLQWNPRFVRRSH